MPQIWPMNWVFLFLIFSLTFLSFLVGIYFFKISNPLPSSKGVLENPLIYDWKW